MLLLRIVDAIRAAVPGAADALAERLAAAPTAIDALAATRDLVAELSRLLVDPLVLVIDDAEHLDGAEGSLEMLGELIRAEVPLLHVAVSSRRSLGLRVAKPRAAGRLAELTTADLSFDAEECAALLRTRTGLDPSGTRVEEMMEATEGWPLGVALAAGVAKPGASGADPPGIASLSSAPDLRSYLSEELVESLEPELREAAMASSVVRVLTPEVRRALDLPDDFATRIERAGLLVRRIEGDDAIAYHPLLREFLLERLRGHRDDEEWRRLHAAVAPAVAESGDGIAAVEHWLEAESWAEAVAAVEREGMALLRTSPELVRRWLSLLPEESRELPTILALRAQLEWSSGDFDRAIPPLRDALDAMRKRPNASLEWIVRSILTDCLFATGEVEELEAAVEGWDQADAADAGGVAPAAAMYAAGVLAAYGRFDDSDRLANAARRHPKPELLAPFEALRLVLYDTPRGRIDEVYEGLENAVEEMERFDPLNQRFHVLGALAITLGDRGDMEEALRTWIEIRESARGVLTVLADATHAWCALLHAQAGRLAEAEAELSQHARLEMGYRAFIADLAPAWVSALRGDTAATVAAADRALASVKGGPILFRYWVGSDLVPALVAVGRRDYAMEVVIDTFAVVDERYPGPLGCFPRGRLLGLRAWLRHLEGDLTGADADLGALWEEAGDSIRYILRRDWERLEPVVWETLERGALEPKSAIDAIAGAFPEGAQLVRFLDHPVAAVRAAALAPGVRSGDPDALASVERLEDDPDPELASAASQAAKHLATSLPPLRFEALGGFTVRRGSWRAGESHWARPIAARLVRLLLVHVDRPVPEDLIFDALWPGRTASSARRSLQVTVSRARQVLDPPGAKRSAIEAGDHAYRLVLGQRDSVDADEFAAAADVALAESGEGRRKLLERARSLWGGEPLPEERYSDWATVYRERLTDRYIEVLTALVELYERAGEHSGAAAIARELVDIDPLNEGGHRALIVAYARAGRTGHALRQYLECRRALVEHLGVEPAAETSRLQARILAGEAV
jgi:DNA-binding SARP family transcriptional activator